MNLGGAMPESILVFDPGKTTGWSYWEKRTLKEVGAIYNYEDLIQCFKNHPSTKLIVYEGFARANASTGDQLQAIEMCGAIQLLAVENGIPKFKQYPANRKGYLPFAKHLLQRVNVPQDQKPHVRDAVAHGARYLHKEVAVEWEELSLILSKIVED